MRLLATRPSRCALRLSRTCDTLLKLTRLRSSSTSMSSSSCPSRWGPSWPRDEPAPESMAARLAQGHDADLGEGARRAARLGPAEGALVGGGVGQVQNEAVDGHQAHALVEG